MSYANELKTNINDARKVLKSLDNLIKTDSSGLCGAMLENAVKGVKDYISAITYESEVHLEENALADKTPTEV